MSTPSTCPVCAGKQTVSQLFYDTTGENHLYFRDKDVPFVSCRSCKGTGVVWSSGADGPLRITGDVIVEGNIVATGYREWMTPAQQMSLDLVVGNAATFSMHEPFSLSLNYDEMFYCEPESDIRGPVIGGISMSTTNLDPSPYLTVIRPPTGGEFSLKDCHIEVGDMGGGIHIMGDPDQVKTIITGNFIEQVPGFNGMRISPLVPEVHPERKRVLDLLATLPEDMPLMVLTPQSVSEVETTKDHRARMKGGSVQQRGVEALVARMSDYQGSRGQYPLEVSPRLAGLPVSEGDE